MHILPLLLFLIKAIKGAVFSFAAFYLQNGQTETRVPKFLTCSYLSNAQAKENLYNKRAFGFCWGEPILDKSGGFPAVVQKEWSVEFT